EIQTIDKAKHIRNKIRTQLQQYRLHEVDNIYIHRLRNIWDPAVLQRIAAKKIVINDHLDETSFPPTTHAHYPPSSLYVIEPIGPQPQVHILVIGDGINTPAPSDDDIIKNL